MCAFLTLLLASLAVVVSAIPESRARLRHPEPRKGAHGLHVDTNAGAAHDMCGRDVFKQQGDPTATYEAGKATEILYGTNLEGTAEVILLNKDGAIQEKIFKGNIQAGLTTITMSIPHDITPGGYTLATRGTFIDRYLWSCADVEIVKFTPFEARFYPAGSHDLIANRTLTITPAGVGVDAFVRTIHFEAGEQGSLQHGKITSATHTITVPAGRLKLQSAKGCHIMEDNVKGVMAWSTPGKTHCVRYTTGSIKHHECLPHGKTIEVTSKGIPRHARILDGTEQKINFGEAPTTHLIEGTAEFSYLLYGKDNTSFLQFFTAVKGDVEVMVYTDFVGDSKTCSQAAYKDAPITSSLSHPTGVYKPRKIPLGRYCFKVTGNSTHHLTPDLETTVWIRRGDLRDIQVGGVGAYGTPTVNVTVVKRNITESVVVKFFAARSTEQVVSYDVYAVEGWGDVVTDEKELVKKGLLVHVEPTAMRPWRKKVTVTVPSSTLSIPGDSCKAYQVVVVARTQMMSALYPPAFLGEECWPSQAEPPISTILPIVVACLVFAGILIFAFVWYVRKRGSAEKSHPESLPPPSETEACSGDESQPF
eukprot:TRINITY_DN7704_c0_g1_i1.p1 TRINITY_DN7704_c0_g1~~TRINITY_DN7704_c0_g1_i1.p1  ORF type:complete len:590 (+),score=88.96 TRINITY_DN7704_c0_g1_i1:161-1930(+)